jgi:radical SAM superfamily enzyme YgiQ (UPF0313 family)
MKVLFLNPPPVEGVNVVREGRCMQRTTTWQTVWAPVSLATSAAVCRDAGIEVRLVDGIVEDIDLQGLKELVADFRPSLVVINTATVAIESDVRMAAHIRDAWPEARTCVMGVHVSSFPEESLAACEDLDIVIRGEPEYSIRDAALAIAGEKELDGIPGLTFRAEDGSFVNNEKRTFVADLDEVPFPAWDLVDTGKYRMPLTGRKFVLVASARGCPYACTFCANKIYYGARLRRRSPERIVDEMEWIVESFGIRDFLIWSESFTNDQEYAIATAEEIVRRGLKIRWVCNSRVDTVSPRLLRAIKNAGCWMIGFGIESGNQQVLDSVRKGTNIAEAVMAVRMAQDVGLEVTGHCVLGFPGETEETMQETIDFAKYLKLDYTQFYCAVPFPGSRLYEECLENGWLDETDWSYYEQNVSIITTPHLSADRVVAARERAYREYYRQPRVVMNAVKNLRSGRDLAGFGRMMMDFLPFGRGGS